MTSAPVKLIERGHEMYRDGKHKQALEFYTEALSMAVTKSQKIALHSNRAACFLKLHDFILAAQECTSVLELDHKHTGALMLRAQTLVTLKEYQSALFDVNRLIDLNPSSEVYQNLQARLKSQLFEVFAKDCIDNNNNKVLAYDVIAIASLGVTMFLIVLLNSVSVQGQSLPPIPESEAEVEEEEINEDTPHITNKCTTDNMEEKEDTEIGSGRIVQHRQDEKNIATERDTNRECHAVPDTKLKGHTKLDYSRWDQLETDSSDDEEDDEDSQPQYQFRVKAVNVRRVK